MTTMTDKYICTFQDEIEGTDEERRERLGNKGDQLGRMARLGLPVPPGFTITTDACRLYFEQGDSFPEKIRGEVQRNIHSLEKIAGARLGDTENDPLLVSVRSGAAISMPGMMETILNVGLNDENVEAYIRRHEQTEQHEKGDQHKKFILDCQRRLYEMFGENVYGIKKEEFRRIFDGLKDKAGVEEETLLASDHLRALLEEYAVLYQHHGKALPQDPFHQLELAIKAVEESAMGEKARNYRRAEGLPEKVYTAVNVQAMVFGNENAVDCGTGVGFTRDPATGIKDKDNPYGEFLLGGQGEDVVSGKMNVFPLSEMKKSVPEAYAELMRICELLEQRTTKIQDYEFTVWRGKLYMLQTREGKLTGRARIRASCDMLNEGLIDAPEAIRRVSPHDIEQLLHPMIDYQAMKQAMQQENLRLEDVVINPGRIGVAASPGGGVGKAVFDMHTALEYAGRGEKVILCRLETNPADYAGMVVSEAIATSRGGKTSHAAVVARNKGIPCAVGTGINIDEEKKRILYRNHYGKEVLVHEGEWISVDGSTGKVLHYRAPLIEPSANDPDLRDFLQLLHPVARVRVYANANDAEEARRALQFGAEGIGLARTEYMFLEDKISGEERALTIQSWILADDEAIKSSALQKLQEMQRSDFSQIYEAMEDKPVIIRLLDYPLHELLGNLKDDRPNLQRLSEKVGLGEEELKREIESCREVNPMLGHRSIRLGITHPELYRMQARAIFQAAGDINGQSDNMQSDNALNDKAPEENNPGNIKHRESNQEGHKYITPYIELPLVCAAKEVEYAAQLIEEEAGNQGFKRGGSSRQGDYRYRLGIMYETAAACFEAASLAKITDFGSFGTNDLTQTVLGWSREDGSTTFMPAYLEKEITKGDPFITLDKDGPVAKAMAYAIKEARKVNPEYEFGICGEHAADPASLKVCHAFGLNNVSPAPNQVPVAWLVLAQQSLPGRNEG